MDSRRPFRQRFLPALTSAVLAGSLGGCCTLARLWCGPDRTRWVPISFETPAAALATFQEAVRRDAPLEIYRSLSEGFKRRLGVGGAVEAAVAWRKITEETTGVHLLGTAQVSEPVSLASDRVRYVLSVAGHRLAVELVRQEYLSFRYVENGDEIPAGLYVADLSRYLRVQGRTFSIRAPADLQLPENLPLERLREVGAGVEWKVDALEEHRPDGGSGIAAMDPLSARRP